MEGGMGTGKKRKEELKVLEEFSSDEQLLFSSVIFNKLKIKKNVVYFKSMF